MSFYHLGDMCDNALQHQIAQVTTAQPNCKRINYLLANIFSQKLDLYQPIRMADCSIFSESGLRDKLDRLGVLTHLSNRDEIADRAGHEGAGMQSNPVRCDGTVGDGQLGFHLISGPVDGHDFDHTYPPGQIDCMSSKIVRMTHIAILLNRNRPRSKDGARPSARIVLARYLPFNPLATILQFGTPFCIYVPASPVFIWSMIWPAEKLMCKPMAKGAQHLSVVGSS